MQNDSVETLMLRHYGNAAPTPDGMQATLLAAVRHEALELDRRTQSAVAWRGRPISRRRVLQLVAFRSAGLALVGIGLNSRRNIEAVPPGSNSGKPAYA